MSSQLYHFTDLNGVLAILQSNRMEAMCSASFDFDRVSFTTSDSLWEHGDWRITFKQDIVAAYSLRSFDYNNSFGQYSYEKEWYSSVDVENVRDFVVNVDNTYEYLSVNVTGWLNELGDLYKLAKLVTQYGLYSDKNRMWTAFVDFCDKNVGHLFPGEYRVFVDYDGEVSIQEK